MIEYDLLPGVEIADYLRYTIRLGKMCGIADSKRSWVAKAVKFRSGDEGNDEGGNEEGHGDEGGDDRSDVDSTISSDEKKKKKQKKKKEKENKKATSTTTAKNKVKTKVTTTTANVNSGLAEYGGSFFTTAAKKRDAAAAAANRNSNRKRKEKQTPSMALSKKLNLSLKDPYLQSYLPHVPPSSSLTNQTNQAISKSQSTQNFINGGFKSNIRRGSVSDNGQVPALLPLPDCYSTGPVARENEKSHLAESIMSKLRSMQINKNTGNVLHTAVPLYYRVSMGEQGGYCDILGRPFWASER